MIAAMARHLEKDFLWLNLRELPYFRAMLRAVEARLFQELTLPPPVLDVGCGDGHFASVVFDRPVEYGVDMHIPSLREAQQRNAYRNLLQADGSNLPLADRSIAAAFSNSVLEHMLQLETVLSEIQRVLKPGAPFVFTVPNPGYREQLSIPLALQRIKLERLGRAYEEWFMSMSRTWNLFDEDGWEGILSRVGFEIMRTFRYFSPSALRTLEWGHYFGAPCLLSRWTTGRWILMPTRWNLVLTERLVKRYYTEEPSQEGTYSFYLVKKR